MKRLLLSLTLSVFAISTSCKIEETVYICTGPKAEVYHARKNCRGLNKCSGSIKTISLSKAVQMGRRACKICW